MRIPNWPSLLSKGFKEWDFPSPFYPTEGRTAGVLLVKAGTKTIYDDCRWMVELGMLVEERLGAGYAVEVAQSPLR